jgi:hypothetical protein
MTALALTPQVCPAAPSDSAESAWRKTSFKTRPENTVQISGRQLPKPLEAQLTAQEKKLLSQEKFKELSSIAQLPDSVQSGLKWLFQGRLSMAEPGQPFQKTDVVMKALPPRRLTFSGLSDHFCLISYEKGGRGSSTYVVIFAREADNVICTFGTPAGKLSSFADAANCAIKAQAVTAPAYFW